MTVKKTLSVHNIIEEVVTNHVNKLYDDVKNQNSPWLTCDCENCRMDTICYVLNRVPPRYVIGSRGMNHNSDLTSRDTQISIDIDKLAIEGMRLVNTAKRPYHKNGIKRAGADGETSVAEFAFPTFLGNIIDGTTFEPLSGATVTLTLDGETVEMIDSTWQNPTTTYAATKGSYSFWMAPQEAVSDGMNKKFNFTVEVTCDGYVPAKCTFTVPLTSEKIDTLDLDSTYSVKVKDIFMFKKENEEEK